ncbi:hypothetical protein HK098_006039 [Nowakowskiella sp. JEL0407]|nr:hypothetical protein HK098_006039 [Nowakowskiella sp. JEL0407]
MKLFLVIHSVSSQSPGHSGGGNGGSGNNNGGNSTTPEATGSGETNFGGGFDGKVVGDGMTSASGTYYPYKYNGPPHYFNTSVNSSFETDLCQNTTSNSTSYSLLATNHIVYNCTEISKCKSNNQTTIQSISVDKTKCISLIGQPLYAVEYVDNSFVGDSRVISVGGVVAVVVGCVVVLAGALVVWKFARSRRDRKLGKDGAGVGLSLESVHVVGNAKGDFGNVKVETDLELPKHTI